MHENALYSCSVSLERWRQYNMQLVVVVVAFGQQNIKVNVHLE